MGTPPSPIPPVFSRLFFLIPVFLAGEMAAEVEVVRNVDDGHKMGKTKLLKEAPKEIYIDQFAVWYLVSPGDKSIHGEAEIPSRSEFDLTEGVAFEPTNMAHAYLKSQLESKGYVVKHHTVAEVENTNTYKKFLKKRGGTWYARNENRHDERIGTFAKGVTSIYLGSHAGAGHYGTLAHDLAGKEDGLRSMSSLTSIIPSPRRRDSAAPAPITSS